jgi:hypothetical protein
MILFAINNPKPVPEYDFEANFEKIKIKIKIKNPPFSLNSMTLLQKKDLNI